MITQVRVSHVPILWADPQRSQKFWDTYVRPYGLTKSDQIRMVTRGEGRISTGWIRPNLKGQGPASPTLGTAYVRPYGLT